MAEEATQTSEFADDDLATEAEAPEGLDSARLERRNAALAQVVKFGDPVLRSVASPVAEFDQALAAEAERMTRVMQDGMGVGLAATQLGILRRILVFQAGADAPVTALVNPVVAWSSERDLVTAEEGCLSLPRVVVDVERPLFIGVRAQDVRGNALSIEASGLEARVIQHEVDHLDGVLILQRTGRDQSRAALRALREGESYAPEREDDAEGESANGGAPADSATA